MYFKAAILKIQNGSQTGDYANANINPWIPQALKIANLEIFGTKKHSEPD